MMWLKLIRIILLTAFGCIQLAGIALAKPERIIVKANERLEPAAKLANHAAFQGMPDNVEDDTEVQFWRRLAPRTTIGGLIADADYVSQAIHVHRAGRKDVPIKDGQLLWQGPYGPQQDLWLDTKDFDEHLRMVKAKLNMTPEQSFFGLGVMPKVLSFNPDSPQYMHMSPSNNEEWEAAVEAAVKHLTKSGYAAPVIFGPDGEPESYFLGKNHAWEERRAIARDYAEMFVHSFRAVERANPNAKLVGTDNVTYSGPLTQEISGAAQWGVEDFLEFVHEIDPTLRLKGMNVQGYYWRGLDGYGPERLVTGARHIADLLETYGHPRNLPQYLNGTSPAIYNSEFVDPDPPASPAVTRRDRDRVDKIATLVVSEAIRYANPGGERLIDTAFYYTWQFGGDTLCQGVLSRIGVVSSVHEGSPVSGDEKFTYPDCRALPSDVACTRAPYEAMLFLKEASQGNFVRVANAGELPNLKIAAVMQGDSIKLLVAQVNAQPLAGLSIDIQGLRPNDKYVPLLKSIRSDARLCAAVNETKAAPVTVNPAGTITVEFPGNTSMFLATLQKN